MEATASAFLIFAPGQNEFEVVKKDDGYIVLLTNNMWAYFREALTTPGRTVRRFHRQLPVEILVQVLAALPWQSILRVQAASVSRFLKSTFDNSVHLQYLVEVGASALQPNPAFGGDTSTTSAEAFDALFTWRRSWATLQPHAVDLIELDERHATFVDMTDGVFVMGYKTSTAGSIIPPNEFDALDVLDTKSAERVCPSWSLDLVTPLVHCIFEPAQNLLIGIQNDVTAAALSTNYSPYKMHILSFRHGFPHPDAAQAVVSLADHRMRRAEAIRSQILGDYVAVHLCAERSSLLPDRYIILNWRTGVIQLQYTANRNASASFKLLEPGTFTMASCAQSSYTNPPDLLLSVHTFALHDVARGMQPPFHAHTISTFFLPRIASGVHVGRFTFYPSNTVSARPVAPFARWPFTPRAQACADTVLALSIHLSKPGVGLIRPTKFTMFVLARDLARLAQTQPEVAWDAWGARHTRWFGDGVLAPPLEHPASAWPGPQRYLLGCRALSHRGRRVLDFNPYAMARAGNTEVIQLQRPDEGAFVTHESMVVAGGLWAKDIISGLPYRDCWTTKGWPYQAMYMDENPVGIKTANSASVPRRHIVRSVHVLLMMPDTEPAELDSDDEETEDGYYERPVRGGEEAD
ncbi:hypothetical protein BKA62DRAFT_769519 [Auriculariales sp. MPI-PUGE-AT-0066]|nr:hypothetical protein BKA62DRAFT_769519 [Auriculariales sp. MPI-PUGE-AT-0066]